MGIGNSSVQYEKSVPVKASILANGRWNPRFQSNSGMDGRILFFLSRNCVLERTVSPSDSTSGHGIYKALMQIIS
jgi:hypothetical protein